MSVTVYLVFEKQSDGSLVPLGDTTASSPKAAMSKVAERIAQDNGQVIEARYAAVPKRNYTEEPVGVEVVTRVKVG